MSASGMMPHYTQTAQVRDLLRNNIRIAYRNCSVLELKRHQETKRDIGEVFAVQIIQEMIDEAFEG
jgi:hypothetical protein